MTTATTPKRVRPDFRFFLKATGAAEDASGRPTITVTASSDEVDLGNDRFAMSALKQMVEAFGGMTIFLNHRYAVPEDVFGTVVDAQLNKRQGFHDLDLTIAVEDSSPRAMQTYAMVKNGTRLGVSVGVLVSKAEYEDAGEGEEKVLAISDIIPLEASIVGIPANRRSWVHAARKAASIRLQAQDDDDDEDEDESSEEDDVDIDVEHVLPGAIKGVVGGHSPPIMDQGTAWSGSEAVGRLRKWASSDGSGGKDTVSWGKYKTGFTYVVDDNAENFGGYKMPHHDIVDSALKTHFRGCAAAAVVLSGGRGGVSVPEGDIAGCKAHIARHYHQFDQKAPWERKSGDGWLEIECDIADELGLALAATPYEAFHEEVEIVEKQVEEPVVAAVESEPVEDPEPVVAAVESEPVEDPEPVVAAVEPEPVEDPPAPVVAAAIKVSELFKGLREEYAADKFCSTVWDMFRTMYYELYDILAAESEESEGKNAAATPADKRQSVVSLLKEFTDLVIEELDQTLESMSSEKDGKDVLAALAAQVQLVKLALDKPGIVRDLSTKLESLATSYEEAMTARDGLQDTLTGKEELLAEAKSLIEALMDLPFARKITSAEAVVSLSALFPWLDPQITAKLAEQAQPD